MNYTRRPLDLWSGPMRDWDGITEVMGQNHVLEHVDMTELDEVINDEGLDTVFQVVDENMLEEELGEDLTQLLIDILTV